MPEGVTARHGSTVRVARALSRTIVPAAVCANVGCYLLGVIVLRELGLDSAVPADAWRMVSVIALMGVQGMWLLWRRSASCAIASLVLWTAAILVGGSVAVAVQPGMLLALFTLAAEAHRLTVVLIAGTGLLSTMLTFGITHVLLDIGHPGAWARPAVWIAAGAGALATVGTPTVLGGWYAQLRARAERIADLAQRAAAGEAVRTAEAVAAERRTLAQELHDTSSAHLAAMLALAAAAQSGPIRTESRHRVLIEQIRDEGEQLYLGFERMLGAMRQGDRTQPDTHQPGHQPGQRSATEIGPLVAEHRRIGGATVVLVCEPSLEEIDLRLGPVRSHIAYRVTQEALNNVRKHAPGAAVSVTLEEDGASLLLTIANEAPPASASGIPEPARLSLGYGLDGMRDRLLAAGGSLRTGPRHGGGWSVNALLPHPSRGGAVLRAGESAGTAYAASLPPEAVA
ncbi:sensor histidine kinase [Microbacterium sp. NPDC089698]|uniref:sensor histidine kinase n=1 Tax=Microbacterium sp. NPDC089698 TaxID=3364200 RepID=UPI003807143C